MSVVGGHCGAVAVTAQMAAALRADGGTTEQQAVDKKLRSAVSNANHIIARRSVLHVIQVGFSYYSFRTFCLLSSS